MIELCAHCGRRFLRYSPLHELACESCLMRTFSEQFAGEVARATAEMPPRFTTQPRHPQDPQAAGLR